MTLAPRAPEAVAEPESESNADPEVEPTEATPDEARAEGEEAAAETPEAAQEGEASGEVQEGESAEGESEEEGSSGPKLGPGEKLDDAALKQGLAALLFACPDVMTVPRLVQLMERPHPARVRAALEALQEDFETSELPVVLRPIAGGWRLLSDPDQGEVVARLRKEPKTERITPAALETLAIVAYRQPVSKAEVEAIRGVQSGQMLRTLVDRRLVRVTGRADLPGSPLQYGTTREFLDRFGLSSLKDLPRDGELTSD